MDTPLNISCQTGAKKGGRRERLRRLPATAACLLRSRRRIALTALAVVGTVARAQDRTSDNAITQAEDAFGFSVGRESAGIYSADNVRGYSPTAAGNIRIDGLYFSPKLSLSSAISASSSIKVGLAAQGYPFAAPSGIVDYRLNRPGSRATSVVSTGDSYGGYGLELGGSIAVSSALSLGYGATGTHTEFSDGTHNFVDSESLISRWRPRGGIEITPFWMLWNDYGDQIGPLYVPAGEFRPPEPRQRLFVGPRWSANRTSGTNEGVVADVPVTSDWLFRLGVFRSRMDFKRTFASLLVDEQPDGIGRHVIVADPRHVSESFSGEMRLTHSIADGERLHVLHFSVRGLDDRTQFGGSDEIDFGPARLGEKFEPAEPKFRFGELSLDRVRQTTVGLAYDGRWKDVGEVGLSISRAYFRKATALPQQPVTSSDSRPWLYDGTIAATPVRAVMIYAGFARGLEESGLAPPNARNRNEPLPTILTQQEDAGFRLTLTSNLRLVGGVFNLKRPYFGFDRNNNYLQVGVTDSRGAEVSLTGSVTPRLTILIGGVFLNARVVPSNAASGDLGRRPTGVPDHTLSANLDWRIPFVSGLELDLAAYERGAVPSTSDNVVILRRWRAFDVGTHYRFKVANHPTTLRLQLKNMFNRRGLSYQGPGVDGINPGRLLSGSLTVDL